MKKQPSVFIERPICAVCNKPVDWIGKEMSHVNSSIVFTVKCHGETETSELTDQVYRSATRIEIGKAFVAKALKGK